jgi:hypothetical protein
VPLRLVFPRSSRSPQTACAGCITPSHGGTGDHTQLAFRAMRSMEYNASTAQLESRSCNSGRDGRLPIGVFF